MLSKQQQKHINSLQKKKFRSEKKMFIAEGVKVIKEFLKSPFELEALYAIADIFSLPENKCHIINEQELKKISQLATPQLALAVFKIPPSRPIEKVGLILALDGVRDPGNLGTIIRQCDWFGVQHLICSNDTVDCYNPKVVQATMGSLARVQVSYVDLPEWLANNKSEMTTYGAFMNGEPVHSVSLNQKSSVLVLGNEANGISAEVEELINQKISIPQYGKIKETESLNVATAGAILLHEFRRPK
ncbi:MAG: TrmH family RNA methyltransferase [Bacteroidota bacterium]